MTTPQPRQPDAAQVMERLGRVVADVRQELSRIRGDLHRAQKREGP